MQDKQNKSNSAISNTFWDEIPIALKEWKKRKTATKQEKKKVLLQKTETW